MATFGFSLAVQGGSPATSPAAADGKQMIVAGNGIPDNLKLPVFAPIKVDYRKGHEYVQTGFGGPIAIGGRNFSYWEPSDANSRAETPCVITEQCANCTPCQDYACEDGKCVINVQDGVMIPGCDDGLYCNGEESCNVGACEDGPDPCTGGDVCDEVTDECYAACTDPADCNDGNDCTRDSCQSDGVCLHEDVCTIGRCCIPDKTCFAENLLDCEDRGGSWLDTEDACENVDPSGHPNICPKYGAGIAPQGDWVVEAGPISWLGCDNYFSMGDDYETQNHADSAYMQIYFLRFVGGVLPRASARWSIGFHDETGLLIENVFWPDGINDSQGIGIKTVDFDPALTIPTKGYISFRAQANFGLDGRVTLMSTTCPADKGVNDCGSMWVDDEIVTDFLGECYYGSPPEGSGEFCDRRNGNADCPGGTCDAVPNVLAFEIIGEKTTAPMAACCASDAPDCTMELPWVCEATGGTPQEVGTLCGICQDGLTACSTDDDCTEGGGTPCNLIPVCAVGACCNPTTGECLEYPDDALCVTPNVWKGFGTDCDPNCCEQPGRTGSDNCNALPVPHVITVPPVGQPPVTVTITGDNSAATYDDYDTHCDAGIFNEEGGTKDPGWWEQFELDDCAEIRIDLCCTDIADDVLRPAWGNLVRTDPTDEDDICCDIWMGANGVDSPIGIGRGTAGFARGEPFCDSDNLWQTFGPLPAGKYQYPIYSAPGGTAAAPPGAQYQMHITVGACPIAACCVEDSCSVVNELVCGELGGYWLLGVVTCGTQPDCSIEGSDSPCCTGSCCTGPGECEDLEPGGGPMTKPDCEGMGDYVGGPTCDADPPPCPVCDIEGVGNCQLPDLGGTTSQYMMMMNDRSMLPRGVVLADDFIPTVDTLSTVCTWGAYLDAVEILAAAAQNDGQDCDDDVVDDFRITVYPDAGGKPDDKNPVGEAEGVVIAKGPVTSVWETGFYGDAQAYAYQMNLNPPISGMTVGQLYWLEITNNTVVDADGGTCMWHQAMTSFESNDFHYVGTDRDFKNPAYMYGMGRGGDSGDLAFCLDSNFTPPPEIEGACCNCDTGDCSITTLTGCTGQWDQTGDCSMDECPWDPEGGDEGTGALIVPGDYCAVNPIVTNEMNFTYPFDNTCATTDGPDSELSELGIIGMGADIWVHYTAPCAGRLHVSMCGTGNGDNSFDSALAVYRDTLDRTHCPCPDDPGFQRVALAQDESCNGIADGGAGFLRPSPVAAVGDCYTIRAAGFDGDGGPGTVKIGCEEVTCTLAEAPLLDPRVGDFGNGTRNRYLSFIGSSPAPAEGQAMRVTFENLPSPYEGYNGDQWFIGEPRKVTERSGDTGDTPDPTAWMAMLQCGTPFYADWSTYGVVHVYDPGIVPGAEYVIQAVSDDCDVADEGAYSSALTVNTSVFGDVTGNSLVPPPASPPQGIVDFNDISGCVEKFQNRPGSLQKARADVINSNITSPPPDQKIDFVDISSVVDAFRSSPPPLPGPQTHCP